MKINEKEVIEIRPMTRWEYAEKYCKGLSKIVIIAEVKLSPNTATMTEYLNKSLFSSTANSK